MGTFIDFMGDDAIQTAELASTDKKGLMLKDQRGKLLRMPAERVLFEHRTEQLAPLLARIATLEQEVDVQLLWEMLVADEDYAPKSASELAAMYFDQQDSIHASALFRALHADRLRFRRKGRELVPRNATELEQLRHQREAEERAAVEHGELLEELRKPALGKVGDRLKAWLRGADDKPLEQALDTTMGQQAREAVHWLLVDSGQLPPTSDPDLIAADLSQDHPPAVLAYAETLDPPTSAEQAIGSFSIDDPDTTEVDDVLSCHREGDLLRVDIDIADVAALVKPGDPLDTEARRRATTAYLPTGVFYMLPPRIGCELASLRAPTARPVLRTSVWLDNEGAVSRYTLQRLVVRIAQRLDYERADELIGQGAADDNTVEELRLLHQVALARRAGRKARGALMVNRQEWKVRVDAEGKQISVQSIDLTSPSRTLVAEMMVMANELAARFAVEQELPLIFRTQPAPTEPLPSYDTEDPLALLKLRGLIKPASLSLHAQPHWGLGLECYAQVTSPLRRYGDLVQQRQICAALEQEPPPYDAQELLEVLATVEPTEHEMKRLENSLHQRWSLEYLADNHEANYEGRVLTQARGGYRVRLQSCGVDGFFATRNAYEIGSLVDVEIDRVQPRRRTLRLVESRQ